MRAADCLNPQAARSISPIVLNQDGDDWSPESRFKGFLG